MRWRRLDELSKGEPLPVKELARRTGLTTYNASKHLVRMKRLGVVETKWGRLYALAPAFLPEPGSRTVRLGVCALHFGG